MFKLFHKKHSNHYLVVAMIILVLLFIMIAMQAEILQAVKDLQTFFLKNFNIYSSNPMPPPGSYDIYSSNPMPPPSSLDFIK